MIEKVRNINQHFSWQTKLVLSGSTAIFFTFFLFSFLEYNTVSKWMLNREEIVVKRTLTDIMTYYKDRPGNLTETDISNSTGILRKMNDKDQLIRVYNQNGKVLVSDKNGTFSVLEPTPVKEKSIEKITEEENEAIIARYPLNIDKFKGTIEIVRELNSYHKMMDHLFMVMSIFGIAAILFSAMSGLLLASQLLKPIRDLAAAMKEIKENGFQERMVGYKEKDELTELSNLFNEMMDEIETSFLQQKQFIEDASHELRTPVSILEGHLSLLNRWGKKNPDILEESLDVSLQEVSKLKNLILNLLELTRAENSSRTMIQEIVDVPEILHQLVRNFEIINPGFKFEMVIKQTIKPISMSEQHLQQILTILLDNAIKYSGENNEIMITASQNEMETILCVEDHGIGISLEEVSKVFNRFYRVDKARNRERGGTGLGLAIAKSLTEKYKGSISIDSQEGKGTKVLIKLPRL
ncbi:MAG: HAMP domain-containing histidine kinase [Bacillota bacterium]|nr:HAMP domain-containing histidine kinase [Bacillota bacterium]